MPKFLKWFSTILFCAFFAQYSFASDVFPPLGPTTAMPIAGETDNDTAVTVKVTEEGYLITSSADGTSGTGTQPTTYTTISASDNASNVKVSAGAVFSVSATNSNVSADRYLLLHDKTTDPVASDVPFLTFILPSQSQVVIGTDFFTELGTPFDNGIGFCYSSTQNTCTPSTASETVVEIQYE